MKHKHLFHIMDQPIFLVTTSHVFYVFLYDTNNKKTHYNMSMSNLSDWVNIWAFLMMLDPNYTQMSPITPTMIIFYLSVPRSHGSITATQHAQYQDLEPYSFMKISHHSLYFSYLCASYCGMSQCPTEKCWQHLI